MSTEKIYKAVLKTALMFHSHAPIKTHLDIGSGSGELIRMLGSKLGVRSSACDYTEELSGDSRPESGQGEFESWGAPLSGQLI